MKKIITILMLLLAFRAMGEEAQHSLTGRDWAKLGYNQKLVFLEGFTVGLFAFKDVFQNEFQDRAKIRGVADLSAPAVAQVAKVALIHLSRVDSAKSLILAVDSWAAAAPGAYLAESISGIIMRNAPVYELNAGRGPATGYDDITRMFLAAIGGR